jgi:hypothetical protein
VRDRILVATLITVTASLLRIAELIPDKRAGAR